MKNIFKFLVVLMIFTVSCKPSLEKVEANSFTQAIKQIKVDSQYKWVAVLPGLECHCCIQEAETFMSEHIADRRILFLITKVSSLKIL